MTMQEAIQLVIDEGDAETINALGREISRSEMCMVYIHHCIDTSAQMAMAESIEPNETVEGMSIALMAMGVQMGIEIEKARAAAEQPRNRKDQRYNDTPAAD